MSKPMSNLTAKTISPQPKQKSIPTHLGQAIVIGAASTIAGFCLTSDPAQAQTPPPPIFQETFLNSTLTNTDPTLYTVGGRGGNTSNINSNVCLTATQSQTGTILGCLPPNPADPNDATLALPAAGDAAGAGALRLTSNRRFQTDPNDIASAGEEGFFIVNRSLSTSQGLIFEFEFFTYNGQTFLGSNPPGGDGFSFFLISDTAGNSAPVPAQAGAFGGSLGYAQRSIGTINRPGLPNGYLGIGFDDFGNFSNQDEGRTGPAGSAGVRTPNRIVLRGSQGSNYAFISSTNPNGNLSDIASNTTPIAARGPAQSRRGRITITPANILTVEVDFSGTGNSFQPVVSNFDLATVPGQTLPPFFKFGFAASTGTSTAIHEIRNVTVRPINSPPPPPPPPPAPPPPPPPVQIFRLVKRVTSITRSGVPTNFTAFVDDPNDANDNVVGWNQLTGGLGGLTRIAEADRLRTGDEVEYTIYYLAEGDATLVGSSICDQIPEGSTLIPNTAVVSQNNIAPAPGGNVFNRLQPIVPSDNTCRDQSNSNGTVLFNLGDLPVTAGNNFGFVRFRTRVN